MSNEPGTAAVPSIACKKGQTESPARRKGAVRRSDIPPDVLQALNEGREETITLVEWLAIDMPTLLRSILPGVGLAEASEELGEAADRLADEGVTKRLRSIGAALLGVTQNHPRRPQVYEAVASHTSDMVRAWAAFMLSADPSLSLSDRLDAARRFAADKSVAVRECAWDSFRSYVAADLDEGFRLLEPWVRDPDPNIRRCPIESTRPRGVWTSHIEALRRTRGGALCSSNRPAPTRAATSRTQSPTGSTTPARASRTGFGRSALAGPKSPQPKRQPGPSTARCALSPKAESSQER